MGTIIRFPKQWQDADINYYGLELFVESCGKLLNRIVEGLLEFMDTCREARKRELRSERNSRRAPPGGRRRLKKPDVGLTLLIRRRFECLRSR
jgi:hypothetical protein